MCDSFVKHLKPNNLNRHTNIYFPPLQIIFLLFSFLASLYCIAEADTKINRQKILQDFSPKIFQLDLKNPFSLGNGKFAFTSDVTGFQSFYENYFTAGSPLETKARWAWHSRNNPGYSLQDVAETYSAYGTQVNFPTRLNTPAADWLRQNPHDLPLPRIALRINHAELKPEDISKITQQLNLWNGTLLSQYEINHTPIEVVSAIHPTKDFLSFKLQSHLLVKKKLSVLFSFPRGYDLTIKNTPPIDFNHSDEHQTQLISHTKKSALLKVQVDDAAYQVQISWNTDASLQKVAPHQFELQFNSTSTSASELGIEFISNQNTNEKTISFNEVQKASQNFWKEFWQKGAFVDFTQSSDSQAHELQRRILLSQYILTSQARADIPTQETGLVSSSWYGKHHTEMAWWHNAHWALWNRSEYLLPMLYWYKNNLTTAEILAKERGLEGARWPKMIGPNFRESPGGNALIIWNQPQAIHLAEIYYQKNKNSKTLQEFSAVVEKTAQAISSMLMWDEQKNRYSLNAPIWIAQEIYDPKLVSNPTFELSYWRYGLTTAQAWRERQGLEPNPLWKKQIEKLADLPQKNNRYVAIESIPDTFDNSESRRDHPSFLAALGMLQDARVDKKIMRNTLDAVAQTWHFDEKIWGWDYPLLAMTAARLNEPEQAISFLLADSTNNRYLINGQCPQVAVNLPAYLPANAALLTAVAVMLEKDPSTNKRIGFPVDGTWKIKAEGF